MIGMSDYGLLTFLLKQDFFMYIDNKRERAVHKFDIYMLTSTPFCSISTVEIPSLALLHIRSLFFVCHSFIVFLFI